MSHSPVNRPHSIARIEQAHQKRYWQGQLCQETRSWSTLPYFNWHGKACSQPARLLPQLLGSRYHPAVQDTLHPSSDSQSYLLPPSWVAVASHMMQFAHVPVVGGNYDSDGVVCEISDRVVGIYNMHVNASHAWIKFLSKYFHLVSYFSPDNFEFFPHTKLKGNYVNNESGIWGRACCN